MGSAPRDIIGVWDMALVTLAIGRPSISPATRTGPVSSRVEPEVYDDGKRIFIFACDGGLWGHQGRPRPSTVATMAVAVRIER